ncbi:tRNA-specific 2-thiouridylase [Desulfovibrio sp. OttesenSCG-928-O18]|nr:tRNA-specific 2-thiouridylase [Desulfovibrio sp. OttesenSCG-928-O18]
MNKATAVAATNEATAVAVMNEATAVAVMNEATAVAVSGGMDSLYALAALRERGEKVLALHARLLPPDLAPTGYEAMLERLGASCAELGAELTVIDCVETFAERVITPFIKAYAAGQTPNPCAHCNAAVKFGLLLDAARSLGASRIATGHYIRLDRTPEGAALYVGEDAAKDQSYFLSLVPADRLACAVTPLAETKKSDIRAYFERTGIAVPAPVESQEICFVPNDDYRAFVTERAARLGIALPGPGPVTLADGTRIGEHKGLWQYTEGQRKGLGIAWKEPLYVLRKDLAANTLIADGAAHLTGGTVHARNVNFLVPFARWPENVLIRTRFRQKERPATARLEGDTLVLTEKTPSGPYAMGQIATVYAMEYPEGRERLRVLGGGVIAG